MLSNPCREERFGPGCRVLFQRRDCVAPAKKHAAADRRRDDAWSPLFESARHHGGIFVRCFEPHRCSWVPPHAAGRPLGLLPAAYCEPRSSIVGVGVLKRVVPPRSWGGADGLSSSLFLSLFLAVLPGLVSAGVPCDRPRGRQPRPRPCAQASIAAQVLTKVPVPVEPEAPVPKSGSSGAAPSAPPVSSAPAPKETKAVAGEEGKKAGLGDPGVARPPPSSPSAKRISASRPDERVGELQRARRPAVSVDCWHCRTSWRCRCWKLGAPSHTVLPSTSSERPFAIW